MYLEDKWKTTLPEQSDAVCMCSVCKYPLYSGDYVYKIEDDSVCEDCIDDYLLEKYREFKVEL